MKTRTKYVMSALVFGLCCLGLFAQKPAGHLKPSRTLLLYPEGQLSDRGLEGAEGPLESNGLTGPETMHENGNLYGTADSARIDLYFPKKGNGRMVVVCPGGGYLFCSTYNEGVHVAKWMLEKGIAVCVVKYRMPNGHWQIPLQDVQNALRYCRANAERWKVKRIGVMGFSAGGHLAASASTMFRDSVTRPDFSILIYPVITLGEFTSHGGTRNNLLGKKEVWDAPYRSLVERYSIENQVSALTPPTFLAVSEDDNVVPVVNSILYYQKLLEYQVPAELHIFPTGGHGWGFSKNKYRADGKKDRFNAHRDSFEKCLGDWLDAIQ